MKKTDAVIQQNVIDELAAESDLDGSTIGVGVKNGTVHLLGRVSNLADQETAERAARRAAGHRRVVDHLNVEAILVRRAPRRRG